MHEVTKEVLYKSPFGTSPRILGEEFVVFSGKKNLNSIKYYTTKNMYAIRVGQDIIDLVFDWILVLYPCLSYKDAKQNGVWIIFRDYNKKYHNSHVRGIVIPEKSAQKAAVRTFNMLKYFLKNYQTLRNK